MALCTARITAGGNGSVTSPIPQRIKRLPASGFAWQNAFTRRAISGYLFPEIARRVNAFCQANPDAGRRLIRCGIGDVTEPLPPAVIRAVHKAIDEMAQRETFRGY